MKSLHKNIIIATIILVALVVTLCACKTNKCAEGHTWERTSTTATCLDGGIESYKCKVCKATKTEEVSAYGHDLVQSSYTAPTCKTNGEDVKKCSRCIFESKTTLLQVDHDWKVKSTTPSSCSVYGSQTLECSMCHETKTETLPLDNHDYKLISTTPSSCSVQGSATYRCSVCQDTYTESLQLLDHEFELVDTTQSTCIAHGSKNYKCKNCTATYSEELPLAEHNYEDTTIDATCFTHGGTGQLCSVCNGVKSFTETPLLTHEFGTDGYCTQCGIYETLFDENALNVTYKGVTVKGNLVTKFKESSNSIPDNYWQTHTVTLTISMFDADSNLLEAHSFTSATIPQQGVNYGKLTIQYLDTTGNIYNGSPNAFTIFVDEGNIFAPETRQNCTSFKIEISCDGYKTIEKSYNIINS